MYPTRPASFLSLRHLLMLLLLLGLSSGASAFQIVVKLGVGLPLHLEVEANDTIENLISRIKEHLKVPSLRERLVFKGKVLELAQTLAHYKIEAGSTLHLLLVGAETVDWGGPDASATGLGQTATVAAGFWRFTAAGTHSGDTRGFLTLEEAQTAGIVQGEPEAGAIPVGRLLALQLEDLRLTASGGSTEVTLTYDDPLPGDAVLWKFGPIEPAAEPVWYKFPGAVIDLETNSVTLTLTDGALGDSDWSVNGVIADPVGLFLPSATTDPDTTDPDTTDPDTTDPDTTDPDSSDPGTPNPATPVPAIPSLALGLLAILLALTGVYFRATGRRIG